MNHSGFDIHARNCGTRLYGGKAVADLAKSQPASCTFCGARTTTDNGRIAEHIERGGFTRCPASGIQLEIAAQRAASLSDDYLLASESLYE